MYLSLYHLSLNQVQVMKGSLKRNLLRYIFISLLIILFLIEGLWLIGIPSRFIEERLRMALMESGFTSELRDLKKGLFYNIHITSMEIIRGELRLELKDVKLRLLPLHIFNEGILLKMEASIAGGTLSGLLKKNEAVFDGTGLNIDEIKNPLLKGRGTIEFHSEIKGKKGFLRFRLKDAVFEPVELEGKYIPLNLLNEINGIITFEDNTIRIQSISLYGRDIYGRLKGYFMDKSYEVSVELMPEKESLTYLNLMIPHCRVSPGYFRIDIKR